MRATGNLLAIAWSAVALLTFVSGTSACVRVEVPDVPSTVSAELTRVADEAESDVPPKVLDHMAAATTAATLTPTSQVAPTLAVPSLPATTPGLSHEPGAQSSGTLGLPQTTPTLTVVDVLSKIRPNVARIVTPTGAGSGFVYDRGGLVATNAHVVDCCRNVTVFVEGMRYQGTVLGSDDRMDLAVVQLKSDARMKSISLGHAGQVSVGEDVMALGFPLSSFLGDELTVTRGIVSSKRSIHGYDYFQTDAALNPGNSGGPLINRNGEVIGMNTSKFSAAEGVGLALSVGEIRGSLEALVRSPILPTPPVATRMARPTPIPTPKPSHSTRLPTSSRYFQQVSAGASFTCGVQINGRLVCWGLNDEGQAKPPEGEFRQVSAGFKYACAVRNGGSIVCWGNSGNGQTSPPNGRFRQVSVGFEHACAVEHGGGVVCWGNIDDAALAPPDENFQHVSVSGFNHCGLLTGGRVLCWGYWHKTGSASKSLTGDFEQLSSGPHHVCGVDAHGKVGCLGWNEQGQATPPPDAFSQVSASRSHTCGVRVDGSIVCWGSNYRNKSDAPAGEFHSVSAGESHTCGINVDDQVVCWGANFNGESMPP